MKKTAKQFVMTTRDFIAVKRLTSNKLRDTFNQ